MSSVIYGVCVRRVSSVRVVCSEFSDICTACEFSDICSSGTACEFSVYGV